MQTYTPDRSFQMMNAIHAIYGGESMSIEPTIFNLTAACCPDYEGGVWHFHSNGEVGYWVPDCDSVAVSCEGNYYENNDMDAESFGVAVTLMALNRLVWHHFHLHKQERAQALQAHWDKLHAWAFRDGSTLDTSAIYAFLD